MSQVEAGSSEREGSRARLDDGVVLTEVQGIRTVLGPMVGGQVNAGLFFRVGVADEPIPLRGITHLVEHLALFRHGLTDLHYNGSTADLYTDFHVQGTPEEVVDFLNGVVGGLTDLPLDRLEVERRILENEAAGRGGNPDADLLVYRYGLQTYGSSTTLEHGLRHLGSATVADWARSRFTKENAVLWLMADDIPDGLVLDLPTGPAYPPPTPTNYLPQTPAWIGGAGQTVRLAAVVPRSTAASLFAHVLDRALFHSLRQEGGYSYVAGAAYEPRDATFATIRAVVDARDDQREAVAGGVLDVLAALRWNGVSSAALDAAKETRLRSMDDPEFAAKSVPSRAFNLLIGHELGSAAQLRAEVEAATAHDVDAVAEAVWAGALVQSPAMDLGWAGFVRAPNWSTERVEGREVPSVDPASGPVVLGSQGITALNPNDATKFVTVRFPDVVLYERFGDGGRWLYGRDGFRIAVEPAINPLDSATLAWLDGAVPSAVVVDRPARPQEHLPSPAKPATADVPTVRTASKAKGVLAGVAALVCLPMTLLLLLMALGAVVESDIGPAIGILVAALLMGLCTVILGRRAWAHLRPAQP